VTIIKKEVREVNDVADVRLRRREGYRLKLKPLWKAL
jgi:hypothetical protein